MAGVELMQLAAGQALMEIRAIDGRDVGVVVALEDQRGCLDLGKQLTEDRELGAIAADVAAGLREAIAQVGREVVLARLGRQLVALEELQ